MRIDAKWLVIITGVVSTTASIVGGLVMYFEGLRILGNSIEETSRADVTGLSDTLRLSFTETKDATRQMLETLEHLTLTKSHEEVQSWFRITALAFLRKEEVIVSSFQINIHHPTNISDLRRDLVNVNGFVSPRIYSDCSQTRRPVNIENCKEPCTACYKIDNKTAEFGKFLYPFSSYVYSNFHKSYREDMIKDGRFRESSWLAPAFWTSATGMPYIYMKYQIIALRHSVSVYEDYDIKMYTATNDDRWNRILRSYVTKASIFMTTLANGNSSVILAGNFNESQLRPDCTGERIMTGLIHPCFKLIGSLPQPIQDIASILNRTTDGVFLRRGTSGGEYWMLRQTILTTEGHDLSDSIYLLWLRSVASVEDQMNYGLTVFIVFVFLVFSFDVFIGIGEIFLIVKPLAKLAAAVEPLNKMDLTTASELLNECRGFVSEILKLKMGLMRAVISMHEYKAYIPNSIFEEIELLPYPGSPENLPNNSRAKTDGKGIMVVFTDIVNSTEIWRICPLQMKTALSIHNRIIREQISEFDGYEVKTIGDAFMICFTSAASALMFGLRVQELLWRCNDWPADLIVPFEGDMWKGLIVRIGMHLGDTEIDVNPVTGRSDFFGTAVNKAARLEQNGKPGCISISSESLRPVPEALQTSYVTTSVENVACRGIGFVEIHYILPLILSTRGDSIKKPYRGGSSSPSISSKGSSLAGRNAIRFSTNVASMAFVQMRPPEIQFEPDMVLVNSIVSTVFLSVARTEGDCTGVCGNAISCGWNATKRCPTHQQKCIQFVGLLYETLYEPTMVSVGLSQGDVSTANGGTQSQKTVLSVGRPIEFSKKVAMWASEILAFALAASEDHPKLQSIAMDPSLKYMVRPLSIWSTCVVYQLRAESLRSRVEEDEWEWAWSTHFSEALLSGNIELIIKNTSDSTVLLALGNESNIVGVGNKDNPLGSATALTDLSDT